MPSRGAADGAPKADLMDRTPVRGAATSRWPSPGPAFGNVPRRLVEVELLFDFRQCGPVLPAVAHPDLAQVGEPEKRREIAVLDSCASPGMTTFEQGQLLRPAEATRSRRTTARRCVCESSRLVQSE